MPARLLIPVLVACLSQEGIPAGGTPAQDAPLTLDFLVTDRDGKTPTDLGPADVDLRIGGKVQPLLSLELVGPDDSARHVLLIVEERTLHALEPVAREAITKLLDRLRPGDQITYIGAGGSGPRPVIRGRDGVARALESMTTGPGVLYTCLANTLVNVANLSRMLPPGRASTLAVIGRGHPESATFGSEGDAGGCTPRREAMREVADLIADRQINLQFFTAGDTPRAWGFDTLALNTGGTSRPLTWSATGGLAEAVASTYRFYRATFPANPKAPSRLQRVRLRVKRDGLQVSTSANLRLTPRK